jgi:hypothetical protein
LTSDRKHLIKDIRPYNCLHALCRHFAVPFDSRVAWILHVQREHSDLPWLRDHNCPLCRDQSIRETFALLKHISKHLEEISLSALPRGVESDASSAGRWTLPEAKLPPAQDLATRDPTRDPKGDPFSEPGDDQGSEYSTTGGNLDPEDKTHVLPSVKGTERSVSFVGPTLGSTIDLSNSYRGGSQHISGQNNIVSSNPYPPPNIVVEEGDKYNQHIPSPRFDCPIRKEEPQHNNCVRDGFQTASRVK